MTTSSLATPKKGAVCPRQAARAKAWGTKGHVTTATASSATLVRTITGVTDDDHSAIIKRIRDGLPASSVDTLSTALHVSKNAVALLLSMSVATLRRRQKDGTLHIDESDRVVRFARIRDLAVDMMQGDNDAAVGWLQTPHPLLQGESPMSYASTEMGALDVEDLIGRIRHGVFS